MINLAWKVKELSDLNDCGRGILRTVRALSDLFNDWEKENMPRRLTSLRDDLTVFVRRVTRHKRIPATHLLVFMISSEERKKKPYALPVQCLPYKGLSDAKARELANRVIGEMTRHSMKVAGTV